MYIVLDYYEETFGEIIFVSDDYVNCLAFVEEFMEDTDCECHLVIKDENGKIKFRQY